MFQCQSFSDITEHVCVCLCAMHAVWASNVYFPNTCIYSYFHSTALLLTVFILPLNPLQKNAMLGGALTGALISAASNKNKDNIVIDAIAGGAIATASTFLNYLIWLWKCIISAASNDNKDITMIDAIAGDAIATASTFLNNLTWSWKCINFPPLQWTAVRKH